MNERWLSTADIHLAEVKPSLFFFINRIVLSDVNLIEFEKKIR